MGKKSKKGTSRAGRTARPPAGKGRRTSSRSMSISSSCEVSLDSREDLSLEPASEYLLDMPKDVVLTKEEIKAVDCDKENAAAASSLTSQNSAAMQPTIGSELKTEAPAVEVSDPEPVLAIPEPVVTVPDPVVAEEPLVVIAAQEAKLTEEPVVTQKSVALLDVVDDDKHDELIMEKVLGEPAPLEEESTDVSEDGLERKVLVLVSSQAMKREVMTNQQNAYTILNAHKIPFETLDGSDPANKDKRNHLFELSGIRAEYPQFFIVQHGKTSFFNDWEAFQVSNEVGTLARDLGFAKVDDVWSSNLRDAVAMAQEPAVLDVTMDEEQFAKMASSSPEKESSGPEVEPPAPETSSATPSRNLDLNAPAPDEAGMKTNDCSCTIL